MDSSFGQRQIGGGELSPPTVHLLALMSRHRSVGTTSHGFRRPHKYRRVQMPNRRSPAVKVKSHTAGHAVRRASVAQPSAPLVRLPEDAMTAAQYDSFVTATDNRGPLTDA